MECTRNGLIENIIGMALYFAEFEAPNLAFGLFGVAEIAEEKGFVSRDDEGRGYLHETGEHSGEVLICGRGHAEVGLAVDFPQSLSQVFNSTAHEASSE